MAYLAEIPYGAYWSTPFAKWQGAFANLHSVEFAAHVTKAELAKRRIAPDAFDYGVLGMTVPQKASFYGLPWFMGLIGGRKVGGPTIAQACATSVRCLLAGAQEVEAGLASTALIATCDRISNGPHIVYPNPAAPGGTAAHENWVLDNFSNDPLGGHAMVQTAENVARKYQITTAAQHEVVLRRGEQYAAALANDHAFQKRYMTLPFDVPSANFKKSAGALPGDEGVVMSTAEGLSKLRPVMPDGTVTFGGQTHPADGSAAIVVATPDKCREMSSDANVRIGILGFGLGARRVGTHAGSDHSRRQAGTRSGRACDQGHGRGEVAQSIRRERHYFCPRDRRRSDGDEQLWLLAGLGPSARADRLAIDHRIDRGTGHPRRRPRPVPGLRRRRYGDGGGDRRRYAQALTHFKDCG